MKNVTIYKGIEIIENLGFYVFNFNGEKYTNTNLYFAKCCVTRALKLNKIN